MSSLVHDVEHNRNMNIKFDKWVVSGEKAESYPQEIYKLLRMDVSSYFNGYDVGAILIMHEHGISFDEIKKVIGFVPPNIIKNLVSDNSNLPAKHLFYKLYKEAPEQLKNLYSIYLAT